MIETLSYEKAREYGRRGGHARAHVHVVDGELVTAAMVAKRIGISRDAATGRLARRPKTWAALSQARYAGDAGNVHFAQ